MNNIKLQPLIFSTLTLLLTFLYYSLFSDELNNGEFDSVVMGFSSFVIPDTIMYLHLIDFSDPVTSIFFAGVKNSVGPSIMWYIANGNWKTVLVMNFIFLYITLVYLKKTARILGIHEDKDRLMIIIIALLPNTLFYMIGALKEIPTLLTVTAFFYHYLKNERIKSLSFWLITALFRYQLVFPLLLFALADKFKKKSLFVVLSLMLTVSAVYPYFKRLTVFSSEATNLYREDFGVEGSLGGIIESVRDTTPGLSLFAVIARVFQSLFEPFITLINKKTFYYDGNIAIYTLVLFLSLVLLLPFFIFFIKKTFLIVVNPLIVDENIIKIYMFSWAIIFPIAGFSFIHHRYLYPITAFIVLAYYIPRSAYDRS